MSGYPTNRDKRMEPRLGKRGWCRCDMALVHSGQKCPVCGKREKTRRLKKTPTPQ